MEAVVPLDQRLRSKAIALEWSEQGKELADYLERKALLFFLKQLGNESEYAVEIALRFSDQTN